MANTSNINSEFETAKQRGIIHLTPETDPILVAKVSEYNNQMADSRKKYNKVKYLKNEFLTGNPIAVLIVALYSTDEIAAIKGDDFSFILSLIILLIYAVTYIYAVAKRDLLYCTVFSAFLIFVDFYFLFLFIPNIFLYITIEKTDRPLKKINEYPVFSEIVIKKLNNP